MAQKQKSFLIIAGIIFLGSVVLLTYGFVIKAQSTLPTSGTPGYPCPPPDNINNLCRPCDWDSTGKQCVCKFSSIGSFCMTDGNAANKGACDGKGVCVLGGSSIPISTTSIQTPLAKTSFLATGEICQNDPQCISQNCCAGKCIASDTHCPGDSFVCFSNGEGCIASDIKNNCCNPYGCDPKDNICKPIPTGGFSTPIPSTCKGLKEVCTKHTECCSLNCPSFDTLIDTQSACGLPLPSGGQIGPGGGGGYAPFVLAVSYPNGGEKWQAGQLYQIKWRTQGPDSLIGIVIWNYDYPDQTAPQAYKIIATNNNKPIKGALDQGGTSMSYPWEIQSDFFTSNGIWKSTDNLKIIITETTTFGGQAGKDLSDGYFNVVPAPAQIKKCPDCGNGVLNLCDKNECLGIDPHCLFSSYVIGGKCSPGGCATDQECVATYGCGSEYLAKCDNQKRSCFCVPAVTEQKIPFKIITDNGQVIPQATVKVFDSQSKQVGSCVTGQNGSCATNELIPIGYGSEAFPMKSYSTQVFAGGFFTNSNVRFDAVLNMDPVQVALYKNTQTTFKATIDLGDVWGIHVGIAKKGGSAASPLQECFAINPPKKCAFSLPNGAYQAFIVDYQFCGLGEGCFTDFEINNGDAVVNLVVKAQKPCSRTDGGDEYTKGAIRGGMIDHCVTNASFAYIPSLEGVAVAQYNCNGWPVPTACPNGCYDGACLIDCSKMSLSLGGFCAKEDALNMVCGKEDKVSHQFLSDSFCDKQGGNYCVFCAKPCSTKDDCGYLTNCPNNETKITEPDCVNNKCACRDLTCSQDSNCANITCASDQTPICDIKTYYGASPILLKGCFCLNNTSQKRILVHADDNFTTEDLPGILVSILDKGKQVASCVTSDPRGKCTIPALTFSPASGYSAVVKGVPGYKDAEIKLVSRSNVDDVSANFHLLSSATDVVTCSKNNDCANFPCSLGQNPTCSKDRCACQSGEPVIGCGTDNDCVSLCSNGQKQVCANSLCGCKDVVVPPKSLPDLTVTPTLSCLKPLYNTGESISGCSINIKNIGTAPTTIAPKTNLYNVTNSQQWQMLSQIATPGVLGQNASAIITFGNFALTAPGTYQLRACIDDDPKVIEELDENNNCSAVLPVTVKTLPITAVFKITTGSLEDQKPVPNAKVKLFLDSPSFSEANMANLAPAALCSQPTDAQGMCAAENLLEGKKYIPYVEASGYECTSWWCGKNQIFTAKANDEIHGLMLSLKDVVVPPKSLPDLTVTPTLSCLKPLYNTGESISGCSINIKNIGTAPTTIAPKTNLYNVTNSQQWQMLSQIATPGVLGQNASAIITFGNFALTAPGTYQLRACIDDDPKVIEELDENNNCSAVLPITVEASLKIAKTSFRAVSGNNKAPVVGAQISLSPVDSPNTQKASCSTDSAGLCSADLISGVKYSVSASAKGYTYGSDYPISFTAQLNDYTHTLIFELIPAEVFLPDLKVIGVLACSQTSYNVGDSISECSVNIKNIGTAPTTIAPKTNLYNVTNSQQWQRLGQVATPSVLGQNASAIIAFNSFEFAAPGTYQLRACIDDDPKVIEELDENNNCSDPISVVMKTSPLNCFNCGDGILNTCDEQECYGLGNCAFFNGFLGLNNKCFDQTDCKIFCKGQATKYICGNNGTTYINECMAKCDKQAVAYQGQCKQIADCVSIYGTGWSCGTASDQISRCGQGKGSLRPLLSQLVCDQKNTPSCFTCATTECDTNDAKSCANFSCPANQTPQCLNSQCACKDATAPSKLLPDLKVTSSLVCPQTSYSIGDLISGCSINIKNIGTSNTTIAPKTNLYDVTGSAWKQLSQIPYSGVLGQNASAIITFGNFGLTAPGAYQLRACVDDDPKVIEELDENNNCSGVLPIEVKTIPGTKPITVISPNGREIFEIGKTYKLDWQASGLNSTSKLKVFVCTDQSTPICLSSVINNGVLLPVTQTTLAWTIPANIFNLFAGGISTNDRFRIQVSEILANNSTGIWDRSDDSFSIVTSAPAIINCASLYGTGWWCGTEKDKTIECGQRKGSLQLLPVNQACDTYGTPSCVNCAITKCLVTGSGESCDFFPCSTNQTPQCLNSQCVCKDIAVPSECVCTTEYSPVCGKDGKTYSNKCQALCAKTQVDYEGECRNIPRLIDCKSKYNSTYWCSSYVDWTKQCAGKADPNAIKQEVLCNENSGDYCVTCASNVKPLCSDCGKGTSTCDEKDCYSLGKECIFSKGLSGLDNKCSSQNEAEIKVSLPGENPAEMVIPKGTFIVTVVPAINVLNANSVDASGLSSLGRKLISGQVIDFSIKDANGDEIHNFSQPIAIQIPYTNEQIKGINEDDLKISVFNEETNKWEVLPTTVDKQNKLLKARTSHFSLLAMTAAGTATGPADTSPPAKEIPTSPACKNAKACCNLYCGDMAKYTMPVGTACVCSHDNPKGNEEGIIDRATNWIFYLGLILAPLFILIGAFMIMAGGGNSKKGKNAEGIEGIFNPTVGGGKKMIIYAVIGLALALCTRLIYHLVRFLIGQ